MLGFAVKVNDFAGMFRVLQDVSEICINVRELVGILRDLHKKSAKILKKLPKIVEMLRNLQLC